MVRRFVASWAFPARLASSLPIKADYNPDRVFPLPPSDNEAVLFSDGSKSGRKWVPPLSTSSRQTPLRDPTSTHPMLPLKLASTPHHRAPTRLPPSLDPTSSPSHATCLYSMQNYMLLAARSSTPHPSLPHPGLLA